MVASAIYIVDGKGKTLISRTFRKDAPESVVQSFKAKVLDSDDELAVKPFLRIEGDDPYTLVHIGHNNIHLLAPTKKNSNAQLIVAFLYKLVQVFGAYFRHVDEESVRDNFVIIYELLDEMMDFGYPQVSEPSILKEYITQDYHVKNMAQLPPTAATNDVSWRSEGVKHAVNEVFLDVIETLNIIVSSTGTVLRSEIIGRVMCKSNLSGMPELRLGLNERFNFGDDVEVNGASDIPEMEDVKFHQCVRLNKFDADKTISFVPPDGAFQLMSYRVNTHVKPLIWADCILEQRASRLDFMVKARTQLKSRLSANGVKIRIPVLPDVTAPKFDCPKGKAKYNAGEDTVDWSIKNFKANHEYSCRGNFRLPSIGSEQAREQATRRPLMVDFEVPYFAVSGLQVKFLKVIERSGYQALPWVRYITRSGDYQIRMF